MKCRSRQRGGAVVAVPGESNLTLVQWEMLYHEDEAEVPMGREISIDHCTEQEWEEFLRYLEEKLGA